MAIKRMVLLLLFSQASLACEEKLSQSMVYEFLFIPNEISNYQWVEKIIRYVGSNPIDVSVEDGRAYALLSDTQYERALNFLGLTSIKPFERDEKADDEIKKWLESEILHRKQWGKKRGL